MLLQERINMVDSKEHGVVSGWQKLDTTPCSSFKL